MNTQLNFDKPKQPINASDLMKTPIKNILEDRFEVAKINVHTNEKNEIEKIIVEYVQEN